MTFSGSSGITELSSSLESGVSGFAGVLVDVLPPPVEPPLPPLPGLDGPSSPQAVSIETAMAAASRQTAAFLKSLIVDTSIVCSEYPRMCSIYHIIPPPPNVCVNYKIQICYFYENDVEFCGKITKNLPCQYSRKGFPSITALPFSAWPAPRSGWCIPWYTGRASHRRRGADLAP